MKITQENINNCDSNIFGEWINNEKIINELSIKFNNVEPFEHIILPNFLNGEIADKNDSDYSRMIISQSGLGLPNKLYYFDKDKEKIRTEYKKYIARILLLFA